jgi:hypothetical protein
MAFAWAERPSCCTRMIGSAAGFVAVRRVRIARPHVDYFYTSVAQASRVDATIEA